MDEDSNRKIFIDVSNAFNYEINSILYSKNIRLRIENDYLDFFRKYPDKFILRFDINEINDDPKFPYLPKLFPWQKGLNFLRLKSNLNSLSIYL